MLHSTRHLKVLVAHRPGFVQPVLLARMAATLDHLTGGGRIAIHFITGGDEADQRREGDFVAHDGRYRRTGEVMSVLRRIWSEDVPFDFDGEFFRYEDAFSSVKPVTPGGIPLFFGGASPAAIEVGAAHADVYAFWGEPREAGGGPDGRHRTGRRPKPGAPFATASPSVRSSPTPRTRPGRRPNGSPTKTAERIESGQGADGRSQGRRTPGWAETRNATFSVDRDTGGTTSVGRKRLIEMSAEQDVYDERLWMKVANLTGAAGNSTALVGTPEQVAEAMLRYYDLGISTVILKGFDPLDDAIDFGEQLLPLVRQGAELRDAALSPDPTGVAHPGARSPPPNGGELSGRVRGVSGMDDSMDLELAAASLRADGSDVRILVKALADQLAEALGSRLEVRRSGREVQEVR